jgi:hypothetical protein
VVTRRALVVAPLALGCARDARPEADAAAPATASRALA